MCKKYYKYFNKKNLENLYLYIWIKTKISIYNFCCRKKYIKTKMKPPSNIHIKNQ